MPAGGGFCENHLPFPLTQLKIQVHDQVYPIRMKKGIRLGRRRRITSYRLEIPAADLAGFDTSNKVFVVRQEEGWAGPSGEYRL